MAEKSSALPFSMSLATASVVHSSPRVMTTGLSTVGVTPPGAERRQEKLRRSPLLKEGGESPRKRTVNVGTFHLRSSWTRKRTGDGNSSLNDSRPSDDTSVKAAVRPSARRALSATAGNLAVLPKASVHLPPAYDSHGNVSESTTASGRWSRSDVAETSYETRPPES